MMKKRLFSLTTSFLMISLALAQVSCQTCSQEMEPTIICPVQVERFASLPSAFPCLTAEERQLDWAKEFILGEAFAKEWDPYRAITCYKRALVLMDSQPVYENRQLQIEYAIILSYYLGNKYQEALQQFESGYLSQATDQFPAFQNLLLIVYDCYLLTNQEDKADCVMQAMHQFYPESEENLTIYTSMKQGQVDLTRCLLSDYTRDPSLEADFAFYDQYAKSPKKAQWLNAMLPGAGYYYVGEKKSAVTSFIINALFTAAAYQFFHKGYPAAGAITASLEMGWYLGGINGAGLEAHQFNTRLFENVSRQILLKNQGFPILMFKTSF